MADTSSSDPVDPRWAAVAAYLLGFVSGAVVLWRYREIEFAAFHAWQSILSSVFLVVVVLGLSMVPIAGLPLALAAMAVGAVVWVALAVQSYRGHWTMLPLVGDVAFERSRRAPAD